MGLTRINTWGWLLNWPTQLLMPSPPKPWDWGYSCTNGTSVGLTDKSEWILLMSLTRDFSGRGHSILTPFWWWGVHPVHIFVNKSPLPWHTFITPREHLALTTLTTLLALLHPKKLMETSASWVGSCKILVYGNLNIRLVPHHPSWLSWAFCLILSTWLFLLLQIGSFQIQQEAGTWHDKTSMLCKQLESLISKLQFASQVIRAGQVFLARLFDELRGSPKRGYFPVPYHIFQDLK